MPGQFFKNLFVFIAPAIIIAVAALLAPHVASLSAANQNFVLYAPYATATAGLLLAIHFHRGRPFLALLLLMLFYWSSREFITDESIELTLQKAYQPLIFLIPINFALLTLMREKGVFSSAGRLRFIFITLQWLGAYWLLKNHTISIQPYLASQSSLQFLNNLLVPRSALITGAACFTIIALIVLRRQSPLDSGILGALASFFIACSWLDDHDTHIIFSIAGALIITQSILLDSYNMAFRDDLTGIPSRRALNENLHALGRFFTIAMVDVDHFKRFNDTYGHAVGDQVLKMVAQKMLYVTGGGKAFRYGGEEFAILFPGKSSEDVIPHLEELREIIAGYQLMLRSENRPQNQHTGSRERGSNDGKIPVSVTVSIGVAESSTTIATAEDVIKAADKALYKAKNNGRNNVSI